MINNSDNDAVELVQKPKPSDVIERSQTYNPGIELVPADELPPSFPIPGGDDAQTVVSTQSDD